MGIMEKKRSNLSRANFFALAKYVESEHHKFDHIPMKKLAADATTILGFTVTATNIGSISKELGFKWKNANAPTNDGGKDATSAHRKIRTVARAQLKIIEHLGIELNETMKDHLISIAGYPDLLGEITNGE